VKASVLTSFKGLAILLQKAGPYLLLEILLPGGTLFAILLFLIRRRQQAEAAGMPVGGFITRAGERIHGFVDVVLSPIGVASAWRGRGRTHDGLEALAIGPTM
jgi:hypothetical protein